jgi:hypothetical protein
LPPPAAQPDAQPHLLPHFLPHASAIGERLQDIAWNMRERGLDDTVCAAVEEQARLLVSPPGRRLPPMPALALAAPAASDPRLEALSRIDRMPLAEKLALFA